jgi:hypothetical protein
MIRRAERAHRLVNPAHQPPRAPSGRWHRFHKPVPATTGAANGDRYSLTAPGWRRSLMVYAAWGCASVNAAAKASVMTW